LIALTVIFIILWFISRAVTGNHYVLVGAPGELLYVAAFDDFLDEWEQDTGRNSQQVVDGAMQIEIGTEKQVVWSPAAPRFSDFDATVVASAVDGPEDNGYGLIFRLSDDRQSFYMFLVSSNGYYKVERYLSEQAPKPLSNWINSEIINTGIDASNRLRVVAKGDTFTFFINDQPVQLCIPNDPEAESTYRGGICIQGEMHDSLTDASLTTGRLGVVAITEIGAPDVVAQFDNLVVYSPSE
jgi:hypothetical protein